MKKSVLLFCFYILISGTAFSQILVPFVQRYSVTQKGGLVMVSNSMLSCNGGTGAQGETCASAESQVPPSGSADDNDFNSTYIDVDGDPTTFSSSSSDLNLPTCSKVTFAGLYWGAYINTNNANYAQRNQVLIMQPGASSYTTLTADTLMDLNNTVNFYCCYKDITSIVAAAGNGTFTIADLVAITGGSNQWAGWSIVVVYKDELLTEKNITVFDGMGVVNTGNPVTATIHGFYTPPSGPVNFELGEIAYDGDRGLTGDSLYYSGGGSFVPVYDALHAVNNVFNSTIADDGVQVLTRNPAYQNTLGYDANIFAPVNTTKNYLPNGADSAQIKIETPGDQIFLRVVTSVIDTYEPDLQTLKSVTDVNGGGGSTVNPGDTLLYNLTVYNYGNDTSVATVLTDTLPFNAIYIPGSMTVTAGYNIGAKTDAAGDDQGEEANSGSYQVITMRMGRGANSTTGGSIPLVGADSTTFTFKAKVTSDCFELQCNPVIANRSYVNYNGYISGLSRQGLSNPNLFDSLGCPVEGFTSTTVQVPVSCTLPPDTSIGGCLPLVFSAVPGIRSGYSYYNSSWVAVTQANTIGTYHGIRTITATSCKDTINYTVYIATPTAANAGANQNLCNVTGTTMAANAPTVGTGTWRKVSGPNTPVFTSPNSPVTNVTGMIPGTYNFSWTISTGCDSTADTVTVVNSGLPTTANAGPNQNVCNVTTVTLAGNTPSAGSGTWILVSGTNTPVITTPSSPTSTVTGMIAGVYTFRWIISSGVCDSSSDDVQITIYALPTTSNAGPDQSLCNVTTASLSGNTPTAGTGTWTQVSGPNTPTITSPGSSNTSVTGMIAGVYVFSWTISNGVCTSSSDNVQITIYALPTAANAGTDQSLCNVTSATFAGNTPTSGTGNWAFVSGPNTPAITTPSSPASTVTGMISGVYAFTWTVTNGVCASSIDTMHITIYAPSTVANAGPDQSLCNVTTTTLAGNTPTTGTGNWSLVSGPNSPSITTPSSPASTVTGMMTGVYIFQWKITNGVCASSTDNVQITVYSLPTTSNAGPDQSLCNVTSVSLAGNTPATGTGAWTLASGPNSPSIGSPASANTSVTGMIAGIYVFTWSITNGVCASSTDSVKITIYALPTVSNAGTDQSLCNVSSATLAGNTPTTGTGNWTLVSGPNTPAITTPSSPASTITGMIPGVYVFTWTITNGVCSSSSDNVQITIYALPTTSNAGPGQGLCNLSSATLAANTPSVGTGLWTLVSGPNSPTITSPSNPASTVTGMIVGVYTFKWAITNGVCASSTDTMQVTIYALPSASHAGASQSLCNASVITLAGNTPAIGTGNWTFSSGPNTPVITSPSSPSSTVTGVIPGVYVFKWTVTNGVCASTVDSVKITNYNLSTISNAGADQNLCNVTVATLAGNTPTYGSGVWSLVSGANLPSITTPSSPNSTVTGMITGVYTFRWTITNGVCSSSSDDVQITIYALPTVANAGADQNLCNVSSATLAGNTPTVGTGSWSLVSGPNTPAITASANPGTTVTGMIPGIYAFRWAITNGVCTPDTDDVRITIYALPTVANAGPDQYLCDTSATTLNANTPVNGTGAWTFVSGPNSPVITAATNPSSTVTGMIAGIYIFKWTITNGVCAISSDTVSITNYALPTISTVATDQSLCNVTSTIITGNTPVIGSGVWTLTSGPNTPTIATPDSATTIVNGMMAGVYVFRWTITSGVCTSSYSEMQVTIYSLPSTINAGPDQRLCDVTSTTLAGNMPNVGTGTWTLISGPNSPTITDVNDSATTVTGMTIGVYQFGWTITNGVCFSPTDTVQITIYDLPTTSNAGPDQNLCSVTTATLQGNVPAVGNGVWTLVSGPNVPVITDSSVANTTVTGVTAGVYIFQWTISSGPCSSSVDSIQITIYNSPTYVNAGPDQSLCNTDSVIMAANQPAIGTGDWTLISGPNVPSITSPNDSATSVTGMIAGTYLFGWSISNGVCISPVDSVQITIYDLPTVANAGPDQRLCNIDSTVMAANAATTGAGVWSLISGPNVPVIEDSSSETTIISGMIAGNYLFSWTISNGVCSATTDTVEITIYALPTVADAGPDQILCNVDSIVMAGDTSSIGTGIWTLLSGPNTPVITDSSNAGTSITDMISGIYQFAWTITSGVCNSSVDTVQITIYALPTVANAGPDQNLCDIYNTSFAGDTAAIGAGIWTFISGPDTPVVAVPASPVSPVSGLVAGTYIFTWSITNGVCTTSIDTMQINVYDLPTVADAGAAQNLCSDTVATLSGNMPATGMGLWTFVSGPNVPDIDSATNATTTVHGLIPGTYTFNWSITNGSCAVNNDSVQITVYQFPPFVDAGPDQSLCNVSDVSLSGNAPASGVGTWSLVSGPNSPDIVSPNSPSTDVTGMIAGTYLFAWAIVNGSCNPYGDTMQVTIYDLPTVADAGPDQSLCNTSTTVLEGNVPATGSGLWTIISGPNVPVITDSSNGGTSINGLIPGVYMLSWTISNGVCSSSSDTVQVTIYALPLNANAGPDQILCNVDSVTMAGNAPSPGIGSWTILAGPNSPVITSINDSVTSVTGLVPGSYFFGWTINNGVCMTATDTMMVTIYALPTVADAGADQNLCNVSSTTLSGNAPTTGAGNWSQVSGPNNASIASPSSIVTTVDSLIPGTYLFSWTISNGVCSVSSDTMQVTIYALPNVASAGPQQILCNVTSVTMAGNAPGAGTGTWTLVSGPNTPAITDSSSDTTSITGMVPGIYVFQWTITNGICITTFDSVQITIYGLPTVANAGNDTSLCNVTSVTLNGNTATTGTGEWLLLSGPNSPVITTPSSESTTVTGMMPGIYVFSWTISNGVCASTTDTVQFTIYGLPTIAIADSTEQNVCITSDLTLAGNNPITGNGMWTQLSGPNSPGINSPSSPVTIVTGIVPGIYTFEWTISNGVCASSQDSVQVTVFGSPTTADAGPVQDLCNVSSVQMAGNTPVDGTGIWTEVSGPNSPAITYPDSANTVITGTIAGDYVFRWSITNGSCAPSSDDVYITIYDPLTPDAGTDQTICYVTSTTLTGNLPDGATGTWALVSGPNIPVITSPDSATTTVTGMINGIYVFGWTLQNGACFSLAEVQVSNDSAPVISVQSPVITTCEGEKEVTLSASGAVSYSWSPAGFLSNASIADPTVTTIEQTVNYIVTGTDVNGCTGTDSVLVEICDTLIVPDAFSPDGDGVNDYFVIVGIENYPDNHLQVFNRWGNLIYEKQPYNSSWDGVPNVNSLLAGTGKVPSGTYFFILTLGKSEKPRTGYLVIKY